MMTLASFIAGVCAVLAVLLWGYLSAAMLRDLGLPLPTLRGLRLRVAKRGRLTLTDYEPDYRPARLVSFQQPAAKGFSRQPKDAA